MKRRVPRMSLRLSAAVASVAVLMALGVTASFGLASSSRHDAASSITYPTNPPPPPPPPPPGPPPPGPPPPPPPPAPPAPPAPPPPPPASTTVPTTLPAPPRRV